MADRIIDGSNRQEPVLIHYPGDDLFAPLERRRGLPIGDLTSQFFANLYTLGTRWSNTAHDRPWPFPERVLRDGSWNNKPSNVRAVNRNTTGNLNNIGFRVAARSTARADDLAGLSGE